MLDIIFRAENYLSQICLLSLQPLQHLDNKYYSSGESLANMMFFNVLYIDSCSLS